MSYYKPVPAKPPTVGELYRHTVTGHVGRVTGHHVGRRWWLETDGIKWDAHASQLVRVRGKQS